MKEDLLKNLRDAVNRYREVTATRPKRGERTYHSSWCARARADVVRAAEALVDAAAPANGGDADVQA